jgi:hypothetical protein
MSRRLKAPRAATIDTGKVARGHAWVAQLGRGGRHRDRRRSARTTAKVRFRREVG